MRKLALRAMRFLVAHLGNQNGSALGGSMKGLLEGLIVFLVFVYTTDPVMTAISSVAGVTVYESASGIWDILPLFWVLAGVGIAVAIVMRALKGATNNN